MPNQLSRGRRVAALSCRHLCNRALMQLITIRHANLSLFANLVLKYIELVSKILRLLPTLLRKSGLRIKRRIRTGCNYLICNQ